MQIEPSKNCPLMPLYQLLSASNCGLLDPNFDPEDFFHSQELTAETLLLGACVASQSPACRSLESFGGRWEKKESIGDKWMEMASSVCESSGLFST